MGVDKQPALLEVVGFQMYFIKDCCYIKKKKKTLPGLHTVQQ